MTVLIPRSDERHDLRDPDGQPGRRATDHRRGNTDPERSASRVFSRATGSRGEVARPAILTNVCKAAGRPAQ